MGVARIVRHFEALGQIPVSINDVRDQVKMDLPDEIIKIRVVDEPFTELRGIIVRRKLEDGTTYMVPLYESTIVYSSQMDIKWRRLACTKELLHIVDPEPICTSTCAEVIQLATNMANKRPVKHSEFAGLQTLADGLGKWQAVATLFPFGLYEEVFPRFMRREISIEQLSNWTQIPEEACEIVMTPLWGHFRETILAFA